MILRRFMKHVTDQNWFAVGLDVLVVITGIFLGMQVTEWNEGRKERIQETIFMNRLHSEVIEGKAIFQTDFEMMEATKQRLDEVLNSFYDPQAKTVLDKTHCYAIFASHIYVQRAVTLPSLTELLASGQLSTIKNDPLKKAMVGYLLGRDGLKGLVEHFESVMLVLARKYSEFIQLDHRMREYSQYKSYTNTCDFDGMKASVAFNNDLIDNAGKQHDFVKFSLEQSEALTTIHTLLDAELGVSHDGEAP